MAKASVRRDREKFRAEADRVVRRIARQQLSIWCLDVRGRDFLDFPDVYVAGLRRALLEAYSAGAAVGFRYGWAKGQAADRLLG